MSLIRLDGIGKIYVSEGNVAVGIRGVNLSFDKGEFVAITGKSGSGKSTLLNIISGMDSYEEGELYIEGEATSHYMQSEWEEYRKQYISFIFQDYNILESFTVLENVELALMHIDDKAERRKKALELIDRVGLTSHIKHKGSKLSGGQKQRTVIARALAKDSPVILADEPTGNLDFATSKEIIELLYEVSRDKLLIIVTHSFDEVQDYATRHVRIFDGAVESDHIIKASAKPSENTENTHENEEEIFDKKAKRKKKAAALKKDAKNGFLLGRTVFKSKPKLSFLLCLIMIIGAIGIFAVTSLFSDFGDAFGDSYMFTPIEGRLVLAKRSGEVITDAELDALSAKYGAKSYLHYDLLLDEEYNFFNYGEDSYGYGSYVDADIVYGENYGGSIIGRYPENANEVFLYLPISEKNSFGEKNIKVEHISHASTEFDVVGIKYFYDNNLRAKCLFTKEGFDIATAVNRMVYNSDMTITVDILLKNGDKQSINVFGIIPSFDMEKGKIYLTDNVKNQIKGDVLSYNIHIEASYNNYDYYTDSVAPMIYEKDFSGAEHLVNAVPFASENDFNEMYIDPALLAEVSEEVLSKSYKQASLFFESDDAARAASAAISSEGYIAVLSDTTYKPTGADVLTNLLAAVVKVFLWIAALSFLSLFVSLCASGILSSLRSDMAVMRSMGIPVRVVVISMYARMLISLIPAFIAVAGVAVLVYTTPAFNSIFTYLYPWQYTFVFAGMIILTLAVTHMQLKNMFSKSVKKTLRGGNEK